MDAGDVYLMHPERRIRNADLAAPLDRIPHQWWALKPELYVVILQRSQATAVAIEFNRFNINRLQLLSVAGEAQAKGGMPYALDTPWSKDRPPQEGAPYGRTAPHLVLSPGWADVCTAGLV